MGLFVIFILVAMIYALVVYNGDAKEVIKVITKFVKNLFGKIHITKRIKIILYTFVFILFFWVFCFHYTDTHEVGIGKNIFTGNLWLDDRAGPSITAPWTTVVIIDTRPMRVCVSSSSRSFNCRLVEFNKVGWREFIETEGYRYYWWDNRFSFNSGYDEEYKGMKDLLRGYSFDTKKRGFIKVTNVIN